ncbi:hypothetical protein GCM10009665_30540 [Kitasatospora nipponensis]|uniref:Uncharacterized protein n=1 Tax=Kitasatospora nipponensis TaxID=258049 RepID=A0ABN1WAU1_9ACTN
MQLAADRGVHKRQGLSLSVRSGNRTSANGPSHPQRRCKPLCPDSGPAGNPSGALRKGPEAVVRGDIGRSGRPAATAGRVVTESDRERLPGWWSPADGDGE